MKKFFILFLILFLQYSYVYTLQADSTIKVGIYNNDPLIFVGENGKGKGIFADIIEYVASKEKWQIEYIPGTWQQCLSKLENNQIDILCTIAFSRDRDKLYDFNKANLLTNWAQLYTTTNSPVKTITDLAGKKIAVLKGDIYYKFFLKLIENFGIKCQIIETDNYLTVMNLVSHKKADAGIVNRFFGMKYGEKYNVAKSGIIFNPIKLHYAVPEGKNTDLLSAIDRHIKLLKDDDNSIYYQSLEKWFGVVSGQFNFPVCAKFGIATALGIIILLFLGSLILRNRVKTRTKELTIELNRRLKAEKELRKSYDIIKKSPVVVFLWKNVVGWPVEYVTENVIDLCGYTYKEFCSGKISYAKVIHPDDLKRVIKELLDSSEEKEKTGFSHNPYRIITKNGKIKWLNDSTYIKRDKKGKITYFEGVVVDITDQKQAEEDLRKSEERYRSILENLEDAYFEVDIAGNLTFFNDSACSILGYPRDELMGMHSREYMDKENAQKIYNLFNKVYQTGKTTKALDYQLIKKDGSICFGQTIVSLITDSSGKKTGFRGITRDITEQKHLEDQLSHAQKMESIGTLTGGIAHDFNNILSMIIGNVELSLENMPKNTTVYTNIEKIKTASLRAAEIVKQLLNFSRKTDQDLKPVNITAVIEDALKFLDPLIPSSIKIQKNIDRQEIIISADPVQINQILINICINASQAMEQEGGTLKINVEKESVLAGYHIKYHDLTPGDYVKITISDTGPGIKPELIARIFDPYFTTKEIGKGTGMGLAVVLGLVKSHDGTINVESKPGKGSTFTILFPITDEKTNPESEPLDDSAPKGSETILFVDDDETIIDVSGQILKHLGYRVQTQINPEKALKLFKSKPFDFDLVITDMTMPGMTGVQLSEKLMNIRSDIPVIICTGHSSLIDEKKAKQLGIASYIMKPVSMINFAKTIRTVLDKK